MIYTQIVFLPDANPQVIQSVQLNVPPGYKKLSVRCNTNTNIAPFGYLWSNIFAGPLHPFLNDTEIVYDITNFVLPNTLQFALFDGSTNQVITNLTDNITVLLKFEF